VCKSMEPLQMFFAALAQRIAGVDMELPVGQFPLQQNPNQAQTEAPARSEDVTSSVQPAVIQSLESLNPSRLEIGETCLIPYLAPQPAPLIQACNKSETSGPTSLKSSDKSSMFGTLAQLGLPQQQEKFKGNIEVSQLLGAPAKLEVQSTLPRKASEDPLLVESEEKRKVEETISAPLEAKALSALPQNVSEDFVMESSNRVYCFTWPSEANIIHETPATGSSEHAWSQSAGIQIGGTPSPPAWVPDGDVFAAANSDDCVVERMQPDWTPLAASALRSKNCPLIEKILKQAMPDHYQD